MGGAGCGWASAATGPLAPASIRRAAGGWRVWSGEVIRHQWGKGVISLGTALAVPTDDCPLITDYFPHRRADSCLTHLRNFPIGSTGPLAMVLPAPSPRHALPLYACA